MERKLQEMLDDGYEVRIKGAKFAIDGYEAAMLTKRDKDGDRSKFVVVCKTPLEAIEHLHEWKCSDKPPPSNEWVCGHWRTKEEVTGGHVY